ncbi:MAG: response regulator [Aureliella sp.]
MKILVVDDSRAMRMIVIRTLKQCNLGDFEIEEACNGQEALEKIENERYHFVLSDWNMPEMKGIELLKTLRERGNTTRFGFITSESSADVINEAEEAGAAFLLTKPFNAESMELQLKPVLA